MNVGSPSPHGGEGRGGEALAGVVVGAEEM